MDTKPTTKVPKVRKSKYVQFQIRLTEEQLVEARKVAEAETRRSGYPVTVSALVRKAIAEGLERAKEGK